MKTRRAHGAITLTMAALLLLPMVAGCGGDDAVPVDGESGDADEVLGDSAATDEDVAALATGGTEFAFDLYARLAGDGNLFFSPYSIATALAMTSAGARGNTEAEIAATLHFPAETIDGVKVPFTRKRVAASFAKLQNDLSASRETSGYELNVANSLWGQDGYPFKQPYLDLVAANFAGGFNLADFEQNSDVERVRINKWVEDETREKIVDLIPPGGVNTATTLVLTNAVYFKGQWRSRFDEANTSDATFYGESSDATVPLMYQKGSFRYFEDGDVQVLEMPYVGDELSMLVVLPKSDGLMTLKVLEDDLSSEALRAWSGRLREKDDVRVYFPRFEMTWGTENISEHLFELGIRDAFKSTADFSGMTDLDDLFVGPVFHKAFVAVNEEGTEAAAATAVVMARTAMEPQTVFRADRPFLFVIRDDATGSVLFMGRVADLG